MQPMNIRQAARWADRAGAVYRLDRLGQPDYMAAAVDINTNLALCVGFGDKAYDFKRDNPQLQIRVYTMDEVLQGMGEEEGEAGCCPGPRDAEAPWQ